VRDCIIGADAVENAGRGGGYYERPLRARMRARGAHSARAGLSPIRGAEPGACGGRSESGERLGRRRRFADRPL